MAEELWSNSHLAEGEAFTGLGLRSTVLLMELEGTSWTVTHISGEPVIDGSEPTISFDDGRAAGTTGCNRWFAGYQIDDGSFSMGPAGSTMMMCQDPGIMAQEQAFLRSLDLIATVDVDSDLLTLKDSQGSCLLDAQRSTPETAS